MFARVPRPLRLRAGLILTLLLLPASRADAAPITLTFDDITFQSRNQELGNATVQSYLTNTLAGTPLAGTTVTGAIALLGYDGDGHVVGPVVGGHVTPYTLGTTDGGVAHNRTNDAFIANNSSGQYTITLPLGVKAYSISFDYEIFPDGSGQLPDMKFRADGALVFQLYGVAPGTQGTFTHSLFSGTGRTEPNAQLLGTYTGYFPNGVSTLTFIDWPPRVGIDNLSLDLGPVPVEPIPEPMSAAPWLACLAALGFLTWRTYRSSAAVRPA